MRRSIISVAVLVAIVGALLAAPASAQPRPIDRVQRNGVTYTVYEEYKQGDPNRYLYYVEDGALGGNRGLSLYRRQSGMETAAVIAVTLLFAASVLAVARRRTVLGLVTG